MSKTKITFGGGALLLLTVLVSTHGWDVVSFWNVPDALAQGPRPTDNIYTTLTTGLATFLVIFNYLGFVCYPLLTVLVDPVFFIDMMNNNANSGILYTIWQLSRNIMNVLFALILIGVALATVVTAKRDIIGNIAIKFALAVILVNFSWFFPRVILDVSSVVTATIYKLPELANTQCKFRDLNDQEQDCIYAYDFRFFPETERIAANPAGFGGDPFTCPTKLICYRSTTLNKAGNKSDTVLSGLIMNHGRLPYLATVQNFNRIPRGDSPMEQVSFFLMYIANLVFMFALTIALILAMFAMTAAFIVRIPILWLTISFMPFMFLSYVIGEYMPSKIPNTVEFIFKKFVAAAFLPAAVAVPLTVGFIILNAMSQMTPPVGNFPLLAAKGNFAAGISELWYILWMVTAILVIWKGFFAALAIDPAFEAAGAGFKSFGESLGGIAKSLPLNIPFIPTPTGPGGKNEFKSLGQVRTGVEGIKGLAGGGRLFEKGALPGILGKKDAGGGGGDAPPPRTEEIRKGGENARARAGDTIKNTLQIIENKGGNEAEQAKVIAEFINKNVADGGSAEVKVEMAEQALKRKLSEPLKRMVEDLLKNPPKADPPKKDDKK